MKRMLLNCDQVFDVLTRGPFPTGQPQDEAVERHLRACHECRQLAEALRPAVSLLHEAVAADEAQSLPEYQGALPWKRPDRQRLSISRLVAPPKPRRSVRTSPAAKVATRGTMPPMQPRGVVRLIAAALLVFATGAVLLAFAWAPNDELWRGAGRLTLAPNARLSRPPSAAENLPADTGLLTLAALNLPTACLSPAHRPVSTADAARIAAALADGSLGLLHCCTECHHAGVTSPPGVRLAATSLQACHVCHRG